ncbi:MAG: glycosyltransferase, partial [Rhodocyclaceae bacterium]|nr:glycosyltransferase [Rhodocyclaceae bacterium]
MTTASPLPPARPEIPADLPPHRLSLVVPMYNEAQNVAPLLERVHQSLEGYPHPWEIVLVDDGSSDATPAELRRCAKEYGTHVRVVELMRNFKQTAAMQAGIDTARGDVIVTMDGDLQNDPVDIPRMVGRLLRE